MRPAAVAIALAVLALAVAAPMASAEARPPDLPPGASCDYFHWHNGDPLNGVPPGYHFHACE